MHRENGQKSSERFLVLSVEFTAILDCETSWPITRVKSLLTRRFLPDFAL